MVFIFNLKGGLSQRISGRESRGQIHARCMMQKDSLCYFVFSVLGCFIAVNPVISFANYLMLELFGQQIGKACGEKWKTMTYEVFQESIFN